MQMVSDTSGNLAFRKREAPIVCGEERKAGRGKIQHEKQAGLRSCQSLIGLQDA